MVVALGHKVYKNRYLQCSVWPRSSVRINEEWRIVRSLCSHLISRSASGTGPQIPMKYFFELLRFHDENGILNRFLCMSIFWISLYLWKSPYDQYDHFFCRLQAKKKRFLFKNMIICPSKFTKHQKNLFIRWFLFIFILVRILNYIIVSCRFN